MHETRYQKMQGRKYHSVRFSSSKELLGGRLSAVLGSSAAKRSLLLPRWTETNETNQPNLKKEKSEKSYSAILFCIIVVCICCLQFGTVQLCAVEYSSTAQNSTMQCGKSQCCTIKHSSAYSRTAQRSTARKHGTAARHSSYSKVLPVCAVQLCSMCSTAVSTTINININVNWY